MEQKIRFLPKHRFGVYNKLAKFNTYPKRQAPVYFKHSLRMWYCGLTCGELNCLIRVKQQSAFLWLAVFQVVFESKVGGIKKLAKVLFRTD